MMEIYISTVLGTVCFAHIVGVGIALEEGNGGRVIANLIVGVMTAIAFLGSLT